VKEKTPFCPKNDQQPYAEDFLVGDEEQLHSQAGKTLCRLLHGLCRLGQEAWPRGHL